MGEIAEHIADHTSPRDTSTSGQVRLEAADCFSQIGAQPQAGRPQFVESPGQRRDENEVVVFYLTMRATLSRLFLSAGLFLTGLLLTRGRPFLPRRRVWRNTGFRHGRAVRQVADSLLPQAADSEIVHLVDGHAAELQEPPACADIRVTTDKQQRAPGDREQRLLVPILKRSQWPVVILATNLGDSRSEEHT